MSTFNVYNDIYCEGFFFPSWAIYRCVTANTKVIKTQIQPNPSYFPKGSFEEKVQCNPTY